jgi:hypothetical protein
MFLFVTAIKNGKEQGMVINDTITSMGKRGIVGYLLNRDYKLHEVYLNTFNEHSQTRYVFCLSQNSKHICCYIY